MAPPITQEHYEKLSDALIALAESAEDFEIAARLRHLAEEYRIIAKVLEIQSGAAPTVH